jgi:hypothetical protein
MGRNRWHGRRELPVVRAAVFAFALGLGLVLERLARHAEIRPAWRTNLGLWAANGLTVGLISLPLRLLAFATSPERAA